MLALKFAGIPHYINVIMNESECSNFSDTILKINSVRDLAFSEIADWIRINLPTAHGFIKWYCENDTKGWYYPKDKMVMDISTGDYSRVIIGGLVMKPKIYFNNIQYDNDILDRVIKRYYANDVLATTEAALYYREAMGEAYPMRVGIKDVIFNDPATIVFWSDGTKTVCTCSEADTYDPEKGLALCCMKKLLYKNKGHIFNNAREKWLKKYKKTKK